jgi:hypothetical protein
LLCSASLSASVLSHCLLAPDPWFVTTSAHAWTLDEIIHGANGRAPSEFDELVPFMEPGAIKDRTCDKYLRCERTPQTPLMAASPTHPSRSALDVSMYLPFCRGRAVQTGDWAFRQQPRPALADAVGDLVVLRLLFHWLPRLSPPNPTSTVW